MKASATVTQDTLLQNLDAAARQLAAAYQGFDQSCDPDLTAFYLHEIDALRARHSYLFRKVTDADSAKQIVPAEVPPQEGGISP